MSFIFLSLRNFHISRWNLTKIKIFSKDVGPPSILSNTSVLDNMTYNHLKIMYFQNLSSFFVSSFHFCNWAHNENFTLFLLICVLRGVHVWFLWRQTIRLQQIAPGYPQNIFAIISSKKISKFSFFFYF